MKWEKYTELFENSNLKILEFNLDCRTVLSNYNRKFPHYLMSYLKEGSCRLHLAEENKDILTEQGYVILVPPNTVHDHVKDNHDKTIFMWWHFTYYLLDCFDLLSLFNLPVCFTLIDKEKFEAVFSEFIQYAFHAEKLSDHIIKEAKALELFGILLESLIETGEFEAKNDNADFLKIFKDVINSYCRPVQLKDLAQKYHMNATYISNQFKKIYGVSPISLLRELSFTHAKKLLSTSDETITEISKMLGYKDLENFIRFFKNRSGISPLKFRNHIKELRALDFKSSL